MHPLSWCLRRVFLVMCFVVACLMVTTPFMFWCCRKPEAKPKAKVLAVFTFFLCLSNIFQQHQKNVPGTSFSDLLVATMEKEKASHQGEGTEMFTFNLSLWISGDVRRWCLWQMHQHCQRHWVELQVPLRTGLASAQIEILDHHAFVLFGKPCHLV